MQESWQVSLPTSIHSFVACVPDAHAILVSNVHMEQVRWSDVTCNHLKRTACSWQSAGTRKLASLLSHFYAQLRCVCARCPCDSWIPCAHGASALKWCYLQRPEKYNLFMTTCQYRKTGKFPFPLLSTASLRVCQMPLRFLDPMCTWSECAEVLLPATAWKEQLVHDNLPVQENWQISLPTSIHSFVACVPDAPAILGSYVHMERVR